MKSNQFTNLKRLVEPQPAVIKIWPTKRGESEDSVKMDCQTNGVNKVEVYAGLKVLMKQLALDIVKEGKRLFGDNDAAFDAWVLRQQQADNFDN